MDDDANAESRAAALTAKAEKARGLARSISDEVAVARLLAYAEQLDKEARDLNARLAELRVNREIMRQTVAELKATSQQARDTLAEAKAFLARKEPEKKD